MKRIFLIAGGTVGGLGAVLAITPPQLSSTTSELAFPSAGASAATPTQTPTAAAATTAPTTTTAPSATATPTKKSTAPTKSTTTSAPAQSAKPAATQAAAPATQAPAPAPAAAVNGTFTGDSVNVQYGNVQVKITVVNGKITDAQAIQAPTGKNDRYTNMSVPVLRQRTLAAQSANISGVSGASYTSYGWYTSLVSALAKAKL
jgi:uncharacterized protein with FMN-binding domain